MEPKKKKLAITLSVVVAIIAATTIGFVLKLAHKDNLANNVFNLTKMNNTFKPNGEKITEETIPEENTTQAKQLAIKLYNIANDNLKNDEKVAYYVRTTSEVLGVPTGGYRFFIKNGNKHFNTDFFYVDDSTNGNKTLKTIIKGVAKESTQYAIRSYYDADLKKGYEEKAKEIEAVLNDGKLEVATNFEDLYYHNEIQMPAWMKGSEEPFQYCDFILDLDTIKTCKVSYDSKNGFYTINLTLDCSLDKTMGDSLKYLIEGAGDQNARYIEITQTIEIWDNGRYKKHFSYNAWHAPKAYNVPGFAISSANDYQTVFYYDDFSVTIENYPYADTAAQSIG